MKLIFLGTGTSTGVPQLRCSCPACRSTDPHDKRLRCSALVQTAGTDLLIDCGPDFYRQMLQYHHNGDLTALLVTHHHYDHVGGIDDLRPYCRNDRNFPVYCRQQTADDLHARVPYCFAKNPYPGVPHYDIHIVEPYKPFKINDIEILPIEVNHFRIEILGFKIGNLAYITDAKHISQRAIDAISGVDTLVINALRHQEHMSHITLDEALSIIGKVKPRQAFLTHISHDMGRYADVEPTLPENVHLSFDGLTVDIPE